MTTQTHLTRENSERRRSYAAARAPLVLPFGSRSIRTRRLYQAGLVMVDALLLFCAFLLAYWLRFVQGVGIANDVVPDQATYWRLIWMLVPLWILVLALMRSYDYGLLLGGTNEYMAVANGCTWGAMAIVVLAFIDVEFSIARGWLVYSWFFAVLLLCTGRLLMRRVAYYFRRYGYFVSPALIVGTNEEAATVAGQLTDAVASGMHLLGYVSTSQEPITNQMILDSGLPVLGNVSELATIIERTEAEEVIVSASSMHRQELLQVTSAISESHKAKVFLTSGLYEVLATNMEITTRAYMPLVNVHRLRLNRTELLMKSALDALIILLALPILLPLFILLTLAVAIDSPGPILYRRRVLGVGGRTFDAFKFRTMYVNGDEILEAHPELKDELDRNHKLKNDPRVTRVGAFLRRYSLDELPQLINVILGQMSIVGPRMIHPSEQSEYGQMRYNLLSVRPGLTGMWQVSGRSDLSYDERVRLDMYYVRNYSIWLDIQILFFQTIPAVLKGRGAY